MEQETFFSKQSEKQNFAKNYKKYGTTTNHLKRNSNTEVLIKHNLCKNETLQGIALKYGCSVSGTLFLLLLRWNLFVVDLLIGFDNVSYFQFNLQDKDVSHMTKRNNE